MPHTSHSFAQWALMVATGLTVWIALYGNMPLKPEFGDASLTALVFAKAVGATTIITSSSDKTLDEVRRIINGQGVNYVVVIRGVGTIQQSLKSVAHGAIVF
ncbi:hypothetical protein BJ170DRAFT_682094 [Xylariales sp. AK1849]|nr:hypothetical protein BJ170DRAFT_682094 [Xylariales sp. AK1849]